MAESLRDAVDTGSPLLRLLQDVPIFKEVEERILLELVEHARRRRFGPHEALFHEGDSGQSLYIIISGYIRIERTTPSGAVIHLAQRGPGDHIGELSLLDGEPRMADAVTLEPCELLILDRTHFIQCMDKAPRAGLAVMRSLARRLRQAADDMEDFREMDVLGRLSKAILDLVTSHGVDDPAGGRRVSLKVTQQDLANQIGTTPESISRALSNLKDARAIRFEGRTLIVLSAQKLRRYTER